MSETFFGGQNNLTDESHDLLMSYTSYYAAAIALVLIGFFGFFLNLGVIFLMVNDKHLWTPLNVIVFSLVCSDFSVSVLGNPWTLMSAFNNGWMWGSNMCIVYGFFMSLLGISSITALTVLAFERFMIVSKPFQHHYLNRQRAWYAVAGIWIYAFILTAPPLFGWGRYGLEAANISCSVNWEEQSPNAQSYILYLFVFGLIIPVFVIVYSYAHIFATIRMKGQICRMESKITNIILLMIITFMVAWTPYAAFALTAQFGDSSSITPATGVLPALIAKSSICYNPIIYAGTNTQFRQSLRQLLRRSKKPDVINSICETYALETTCKPYQIEDKIEIQETTLES